MKRRHLQSLFFEPLPLGRIKPAGWLRRQLRIQADGLSGHLDEFWLDIKDSGWFGGKADGWERAPYWLDGVIPLAFLLEDKALTERVARHVEYIISHQHEDGWLGPKPEHPAKHDIWSLLLALKALVQYHEATGQPRIVDAVARCLRRIELHIERAPLFNWAHSRWFEALIPIYWLYGRTGEAWLLDLATKLRAQGFDWAGFFDSWPLGAPTPKGRWNYMGHVVNNAMAVKAPGLWWRQSGRMADRRAVYHMLRQLDRHHGMVTGVFSGDECLAGVSPVQGTELCAVVEYMYSLEVLLALMGDPALADRLELVAFNALPAAFSPDMWAHQYDQQVNQVECSVRENRSWNTNGAAANLFGLEPNFGCCTANLSQGWPKFAAHLWMRTHDEGLAAVAYAPSVVEDSIRGVPVRVELHTDYPFRDALRFAVCVDAPVRFPLLLRIPQWCRRATIECRGEEAAIQEPGGYHRLEREWAGRTEVTLKLPMAAEACRRHNGALAVQRGPLVYSLKIGETWKRVNEDKPHRELPHADWEVYPATPWNYALALNEADLSKGLEFSEHPVGDCPFSPDGAPVRAAVCGRRLPGWSLENGSAGETPVSPVRSDEPPETLTLIPYGCTNLRITEFPTLPA